MEENNQLAIVTTEDLTLAGENNLNGKQLALILQSTPEQYVHKRPAKGGGQWEYVTGGYMKKVLNLMFGWDWDFEILEDKVLYGEVIVRGRLTCRSGGKQIIKTQYGNKEIIYKKEAEKDGNKIPLSIGNDFKAAATDCLKKCAAEIGIAADIYNKKDFNEVQVQEEISFEELSELFDLKKEKLSVTDIKNGRRILDNKETQSYGKLHKQLKEL